MDIVGSNGASAGGHAPCRRRRPVAIDATPSGRTPPWCCSTALPKPARPSLFSTYDDKEISFDEPELFAFAETLSRQNSFLAAEERNGARLRWTVVGLLSIARLASCSDMPPTTDVEHGSGRAVALGAGQDRHRPDWSHDCAAITQSLTGRAVDPAWLS